MSAAFEKFLEKCNEMAINKLTLVDISGRKIFANASRDERKSAFPPLGVMDVVKLEWTANDKTHQVDLMSDGKKSSWEILPDLSGIILTNKQEKSLSLATIVNDDGKIRFSLRNSWPKSKFFSPLDDYGFSYPSQENGRLGVVVWVWSPTVENGVSAEYFYTIDTASGEFMDSHPVR